MNITKRQYALILKTLMILIEIAKFYHKLSSTFRNSKRQKDGEELADLYLELKAEYQNIGEELQDE